MSAKKPKDVDTYITNSVAESQLIMQEIREIVASTIPEAEEGISYNVPMYKYYGILAGFSVFKQHVTFGIDVLNDDDREILKKQGYKTGKKTIQIQFDQEIPVKVIKNTLKRQAKINEAQNA